VEDEGVAALALALAEGREEHVASPTILAFGIAGTAPEEDGSARPALLNSLAKGEAPNSAPPASRRSPGPPSSVKCASRIRRSAAAFPRPLFVAVAEYEDAAGLLGDGLPFPFPGKRASFFLPRPSQDRKGS